MRGTLFGRTGCARRSRLLPVLLLSVAACHPPAALVLPAPPDDPLVAITDLNGLLATAERLCQPVATPEQRELGLRAALAARQRDTSNRPVALVLARCCYLLADWESEPTKLLSLTATGIDAAAAAGAVDEPEAAYLLAVNLGLSLRERGLDAVGKLNELIATLEVATQAPALEQGGPLRVLGMLYLKAPPWPTGPGDLEAALDLLAQAATDYPAHPLNHLFFAAALRENGDIARATAEETTAASLLEGRVWGEYAERWRADAGAGRAPR